jgi:type IV pilus assembly protein PilE
MRPKLRTSDSKGFTLLELLLVIGVLGIIVALAIPLFQNFIKKAKMVEGEVALSEIKRLEEHYQAENLTFSGSLPTLGYDPSRLKYYTITIQLNGAGPPSFLYRATAIADLDDDPDLDVWVQTVGADFSSTLQHGCIPGGVGPVQFDCSD